MAKYSTDRIYFVGFCIDRKKYIVASQSKFSNKFAGNRFCTEEEAQTEADFLNKLK